MYKTHSTFHVEIHEQVNKSTASYGGARGWIKKQEPKWNSLHSLPQHSVWPLRSMTEPLINQHCKVIESEWKLDRGKMAPVFAGAFPI